MDGDPFSKHGAQTDEQPAEAGCRHAAFSPGEARVLLWMPEGAEGLCAALHATGLWSDAGCSVDDVCRALASGAAAAVVDADRLMPGECRRLRDALADQPAWSDFPLVLLTQRPGQLPSGHRDLAGCNVLELPADAPPALVACAAGFAVRARLRQYALREQVAATARAEQRERDRLAQLLHDHLQQLIVAARIKVSCIERRLDSAAPTDAFRQVDALLAQALELARGLAVELAPPQIQETGLAAALHWLARLTQQRHGLPVEVHIDPELEPHLAQCVAAQHELALAAFQAVRELLFNVVKHAHAREARILLHRAEDGGACITVADDGIGFEMRSGERVAGACGSFGLPGIRARIDALGGRLEIASVPGHGTRATVVFPPG